VAAYNKFALQSAAHFFVVPIPLNVFFERPDSRAIRTFRVKENRSAGPQRLTGVLKRFMRLAEVDIEWKPSSGSYDEVIRLFRLNPHHLVDRSATHTVRQIIVPGDRVGQFAVRRKHHVHHEVRVNQPARFEKILMRGITFQQASAATWIEYHPVIESSSGKTSYTGN
jgi:hypothetical protein